MDSIAIPATYWSWPQLSVTCTRDPGGHHIAPRSKSRGYCLFCTVIQTKHLHSIFGKDSKIDFKIGFSRQRSQLRSRGMNHPSAAANTRVVDERIATELAAGRLLGPLPPDLVPRVQVSPMGLVPKPNQPNKFRLIVDLSHPTGHSVNDGIPPRLCSLQYASVDTAVKIVKQLGRGAQLVKLDIKDAYRIIPIHPTDYHMLGISWRGNTYVDRALPFGLRSAPKIFSAVADFISWVLYQHGITHHLHLGAPGTHQAARALTIITQVFNIMGIPIAIHKTEGPATLLSFLGILIDTCRFELRLPQEKLERLQQILQQWARKKSCTRKELESLLGHLTHAATVVVQGRTFLRELFHLQTRTRSPFQTIRLNAKARADLLWWKVFLQDWNGMSFFPSMDPSSEVISDVSGSFGCGAFSHSHGWFQLEWPGSWNAVHITAKELVPIVIAAALWGSAWTGSCVCFRSDNMAVVDMLKTRTSMHLLRCLVFYAALYSFQFIARHVPGVMNTAADAISRNNLSLFSSLCPQVPQMAIPQAVRDLLVTRIPDWGSSDWTALFARSLTTASRTQLGRSTRQAGEGTQASAHNSP